MVPPILLFVELPFTCNKTSLDPVHLDPSDPIPGVPPLITVDMVFKAVSKMKPGKAAGPSGIVAEMLKAAGSLVFNS